ncbi:MAG: hypothetical protein K2L51_01855, partial [Clostridiales bacterium]|nr:hypothetical protein [Clostridiales bacterium]
IINGDDLSRQLAETMTPLQKERVNNAPKAVEFSVRKLEPASVIPKEQPSAPEQPSIVNGDYFGMPARQTVREASAATPVAAKPPFMQLEEIAPQYDETPTVQ